MADWISLDPQTLDTGEKEEIAGVEIVVGLSPFDIPSDVRGSYDSKLKRFVIEFKYLNENESEVTRFENEHLQLVTGKESGCLYKILVNVNELQAKSVALQIHDEVIEIEKNLPEMASKMQAGTRKRHYGVVAEVVEENAEQLMTVGS